MTDINEAVALEEGNQVVASEGNGDETGLRQRSTATTPSPNLEKPEAGIRQLSVASKAYDINHTGRLDEAQQKMRELDKSGRGFIKNEGKRALICFTAMKCWLSLK